MDDQKKHININVPAVMKTVLWITIILALASSIQHIAWTAGTLEQDPRLGWLTAVAIDATLAVIAYAIQQKRRLEHSTAWLWAGLVTIALISALANVYHALYIEAGMKASTSELMSTDWLVWTKAVVLSGLLPLLVIFLGEVISSDDAQVLASREQDEQKQRNQEERLQRREDAKIANEARRLEIEARKIDQEQQRLLLEQQRQQEQEMLKQNQNGEAAYCEHCERWFKNKRAKSAHKCKKKNDQPAEGSNGKVHDPTEFINLGG